MLNLAGHTEWEVYALALSPDGKLLASTATDKQILFRVIKTPDLPAICREGDILVAAIGRAAMLNGDYLRPGAVVVDVGTNYLTDREQVARIFRNSPEKLAALDRKGSVLVGDVDPFDVAERAWAYSPVPGGVGPLTIAMLMANTVASAERRLSVC